MDATIVSDRDKCLIHSEVVLGEGIVPAQCCFHLCQNFESKFGTSLTEQHLWGIAIAHSENVYASRLLALEELKSPAANYLGGVDKQLWVRSFFPSK